jgi:hypothetical protein
VIVVTSTLTLADMSLAAAAVVSRLVVLAVAGHR